MNAYEVITFILALNLGALLPFCAKILANTITQTPARDTCPKRMLGCFFKSQMMRLVFFTTLCFICLSMLPNHGHFVVFGIIASIFFQKIPKKTFLYEQQSKYSN